MLKPIILIVLAALILGLGIYLRVKQKSLDKIGKTLIMFSILFLFSGVFLIVFPIIWGNILVFLLHAIGTLILFIRILIWVIKKTKHKARVISGIVISIAVVALLLTGLFVNIYHKAPLPRRTYIEPEQIFYYSGVTNSMRPALVLLPEGYNEQEKYPVLYVLHGLGGNEYTWIHKKADIIIQNMCQLHNCPKMIVVFPNSAVNEKNSTEGMNYREMCAVYDKTEEDVVNYLMPYINQNYAVKTGRTNTAILGNSMGGRNTMNIAFRHQDLFGYVGVFSAANVMQTNGFFSPLLDELSLDEQYGDFNLLMLMTGREDHICGVVSYDLHSRLNNAGIRHEFYDVIGTHQDIVWQNALYNFCKKVFR